MTKKKKEKPAFEIDKKAVRTSAINDGKKKNKANRVNQIHTVEYQEKIERVYELVKQGITSNEIYATLLFEEPELKQEHFLKLLGHAYEFARNELHKDREFIFQLHMDRYEKMYEKCMTMTDWGHRPLDPKKDWHVIVGKYVNAMKCLKSKEDLIGLHDKSIVLEFNDQKAVVIEKEDGRGRFQVPGYDLDKLSVEEQVELLNIIKEARTMPIEGVQRVVVKTTKIEINTTTGARTVSNIVNNITNIETHDIQFEEMPADVVSKFEVIERDKPEDESQYGALIVGETPAPTEIGAKEIGDKINSSVLETLRKKMKERKR